MSADTPDPFDQADGFHSGPDDWAVREAMGGYDDTWNFLFGLQKLAEHRQWDDMRKAIASFTGDIPFHDFSLKAFRQAAAAGELDIIRSMFARKFKLMAEDGADALDELVRHEGAPAIVAFMLENEYADPERALFTTAARGAPAMMEVFRKAGCDIQRGDSALSLAMHNGNIAMMGYLFVHGADLYRPSIVAGLYGGIQDYQAKNQGTIMPSSAVQIEQYYRQLLEDDRRKWEAYYAYAIPAKPTLEDFRRVPAGVAARGMTLMQIAARAGCFSDVMEASAREEKNPLSAQDLLQVDNSGASALTVLAARRETDMAFDVRLWFRRPEEAAKLHAGLASLGADIAVDSATYAADLQRYRLRALAKDAQLRLRPGP